MAARQFRDRLRFFDTDSLPGTKPCTCESSRLCQQFLHELSVDVGEPEIAALEAISEFGVVKAEEVQQRGVQVVDVDTIFGHVESELVGLAQSGPGLDAAAGQPHRK